MTALFDYSTTAASNNSASPDGWPEGMAPSGLNDSDRAFAACVVGALKSVTTSGTNTITASLAPVPAAYTTGMLVQLIAGGTNTGAATLNLNSLGAKNLYKPTGAGVAALTGYEIVSGQPFSAVYDGTQFVLVSSAPGVGGKVLQVVSTETGAVATGTTVLPSDDTIPQSTEGDQYMSLSITPQNANSTLIIDVVWNGGNSNGNAETVALFQDSTAGALAAVTHTPVTSSAAISIVFRHKMTSGTTSATTFKVRAGSSAAGTTTFNGVSGARLLGGIQASSITITEILP